MQTARRTYEWPDYHLYHFIRDVLVVCPECQNMAVVVTRHNAVTFQCGHCGAVKDSPYEGKGRQRVDGSSVLWGTPYAPVFGFPLWLQASFRGQVFFAFNWAHLAFLEDAIGAELRPGSPSGKRGLRNKLPKWMLLARNREDLLRLIQKLRKKNPRRG